MHTDGFQLRKNSTLLIIAINFRDGCARQINYLMGYGPVTTLH